ncbi:MAG TPA: hypothetical protein GXX42_10600 [Petrimonas sp.]|uniref:hypothetical protein n=1 Tax=Petrimonas sp. TaxID=2023866 RepID=UPI00177810CA|nr:hypothetical protein [Petrimonas sp.]
MEKIDIKVNYNGSGVKTLHKFGTLFILIGIVATILVVAALIMYSEEKSSYNGYSSVRQEASVAVPFGIASMVLAICSYAFGAICLGLQSIARTSLYKKSILEQNYNFIENNE